jgi:histidyl-tRNA synthetase
MLLLESMIDQLPITPQPALYVIIPMDKAQHSLALLLADELRTAGLCVDILFEGSVKSMFRHASKLGAAYALILGETEQQSKTVMIKNMVTGAQEAVAQIDAVSFFKK